MNEPLAPIYIIEGADGVGKTTLAEAIAYRVDCGVLHNGPPKNGPFDKVKENYDHLAQALVTRALAGASTVIDRFHVSNLVYGITRHPEEDCQWYVRGTRAMDSLLDGLPFVKRIFVTRPYYETQLALGERDEFWPHLHQEMSLFYMFCSGPNWTKITLGENGNTSLALQELGIREEG